jgi:hypothetical protein
MVFPHLPGFLLLPADAFVQNVAFSVRVGQRKRVAHIPTVEQKQQKKAAQRVFRRGRKSEGQTTFHVSFNGPWSREWGPLQDQNEQYREAAGRHIALLTSKIAPNALHMTSTNASDIAQTAVDFILSASRWPPRARQPPSLRSGAESDAAER